MKEEIKYALLHALERGENLNDAIISLIQAGYEKKDIIEVANQILAEKKGLRIPSAPAAPAAPAVPAVPATRAELPPSLPAAKPLAPIKIEEKLEEKKKKVEAPAEGVFKISRIKFFIPSLIFIFYYLFGLMLRPHVNLIWACFVLLGLPCLIFNIIAMIYDTKKINLIFLIIAGIAFIGIFIFLFSTQELAAIRQLFISAKYLYGIEAYLLAYLLLIVGLMERI
ncbi:MAG: hypothetical protein QW199_00465 [Candidatus Pacearchaeota archaeon]